MKPLPAERGFACAAAVLAIGSLGVFGYLAWRGPAVTAAGAGLADGDYAAESTRAMAAEAAEWPAPAPQARGRGWVYEVFTPPEVFYDAEARTFRIAGDDSSAAATPATTEASEPRLVAVEADPFPLQLIGYVGEPGRYFGTFVNTMTSETVLLRAGDRVPSLNLAIDRLDVDLQEDAIPESMTVRERRVSAVVREEQTGARTALTQGKPAWASTRHALIRLDSEGPPRTLREGEAFDDGDTRYRIENIRLVPPAVDLAREKSGHDGAERQTLTPGPDAAPPAS